MEIKKPGKHPGYIWIFTSRKQMIRTLWGLCILAVAIILFFGVLGLGAFQNKTAGETFYRPALYKIAHLDFSSLKAIIDGKSNGFDQLQINLKPKEFLKIKEIRKRAAEGLVTEPIESENFTAELIYKGIVHKVRIRLERAKASHLKDSPGYFRVEAIGDDAVEGMILFHLLLPSTEEYMTSWLAKDLMKERGVKSLMATFVNVLINGSPFGIFFLEERFDNELSGHKGSNKGIFFKIKDNELVFHNTYEPEFSPDNDAQIAALDQKWQTLVDGNLSVEKFFDLEKTGKLIAHLDLANQQNPFRNEMVLFSLNPATGLAEPIALNFRHSPVTASNSMELFVEAPKSNSKRNLWLAPGSWVQMVHSSLDFERFYISEAEFISKNAEIDRLLIRNGDELNYLLNNLYFQWPALELPTVTLYGKAKYIRSVLFPDLQEVTAHLNLITNDYLEIHLQIHQDLPLKVTSVSWRDSIFFYPQNAILTRLDKVEKKPKPDLFKFQIPRHVTWSDTLVSELVVNYVTPGLRSGKKSVLLFPWPPETSRTQFRNPVARSPNYMNFDFVEESTDGKTISIPHGAWSLSSDFIIPQNKRLRIEAGAQIDLINHAKIISYSPIFCLGREEDPVVFKSSDATGQGLVVIKALQESELTYTDFSQLSNPKEAGWQLTGAVTFYESPVAIRYCRFIENLRGDDFLNIVRAKFSMDKVIFKNVIADAFDCDYCEGTIKNSSFSNVGNDGVDVSGTTIDISHVFMESIGDKGLSAGEDSNLKAEWIEIQSSEIGVTSKDRSKVFLANSKLIDVKVAMTLFEKKSEFGPASMSAEKVSILRSEIPYLVEQNSKLTVDGKLMPTSLENVKEILYGAEFGKSSK